ncbi:hypothetical protein [Infirmifilum sp.]|uniref:hypothetical protein n=1 Tax=Infirmifilum sp. TaxID=2856575 RepID=UPI003D12C586
MGSKRLILPSRYISLKRLYAYYLAKEEGLKGLSESSQAAYAKAASVLLVGLEGELGFEDFKTRLAKRVLEDLRVGDAFGVLRSAGLPVNGDTLSWALSKVGVKASASTCKSLLGLLRATGVVRERPIPVLLERPEDGVYELVLALGRVKYKRIEGRFANARAMVLSLVKGGRVGVRLRDVELKLDGVEDCDDVKEGVPEEFLEKWRDVNGFEKKRVVIPGDAIVYALFK